ncbi:acyltransferase family protein [Pseudomonas petrae]|uniref:Acyltransferase n=1 Tax=Pseudomonas petrae TaxID=2912190 RepID=A0ABS9HYS0_9PSED|nr:acyltransferase family protein [Pseudomonas petrae]MCF7531474.1 acyltransferase [Pseudomonas petrae]MCF7537033.1 acyltransferase [Pseudomonas petrae]MCF7540713.1 acyltransferase [Pseudomonas petrae]MCF7556503.1 acyltransferase [Pseudomonas petrae]
MHTFGNRRDIDGLRALAVVPVLLFHFGLGLSGGFVGVDVFFVISGYLITSIIFREISAGRFSFIDFWARRARRIVPAVTVVVLATLMFGWILLTPKDYAELGREVRYQSMFMSNLLFMRHDGYFDSASDFKPLLHTWSLAVEEQYYIFFPLLMVLATRYVRHWRWLLLGLLVLSFGLNIWAIKHKPEAAFFLLPMRAWELLCGAMLAVAPAPKRPLPSWVYQAISLSGFAAVVLAMLSFDKTTQFPGWAALLPVLGTTAMIWANGHPASWVGRLLSIKPLVAIGLISYSLYLWHWPIHVYANAISADGISDLEAIGWILLAGALAWLSWRFVELPFRERRVLAGRKPVLIGGLLTLAVLALMGQAVRSSDGVPQRMSGQALAYAQSQEWNAGQMDCFLLGSKHSKSLDKVCRAGGNADAAPSHLIWGDSHAAALWPGVRIAAEQAHVPVWLASMSGCPPLVSTATSKRCQDFNALNVERVRTQKIPAVTLAARWSLYIYGLEGGDKGYVLLKRESIAQNQAYFADALKAQVAELRAAGAQVWLFKEVPQQRKGAIERLSSLARVGRSAAQVGRPLVELDARQAFINQLFASLSEADAGVHLIDPKPLLCEGGLCPAEVDGRSLYKDEDHLSDLGGEKMQPLFTPIFRDSPRI